MRLGLTLPLAVAALSSAGAAPAASAQGMAPIAPGSVEGRPAAGCVSPLQVLVDAAPRGGVVEVGPGVYVGDVVLDRPVRFVGRGRPRLVGAGDGSVVRVRADDVTVEGFEIDGRRGGDLGRDSAGVHTTGARTTIRDCHVREALFGIYVREANDVVVERCTVRGIPGRDPGEKGSGIHVFNTVGFRFLGNEVVDVRDGFYL